MHIPVFLFLYELRMRFKIVFFRMLENEIGTRMKDILCEHLVWQCGQILQRVWRIRKDDIKFLTSDLKKLEHIMSDDSKIIHSEFRRLRFDEVGM